MQKLSIALILTALAAPLAAQTTPQMSTDLTIEMQPRQYRICNDRPARPVWMDEIHPRQAYKALTLMDLYELRAWEQIIEDNNCACETRFPSWRVAETEFEAHFMDLAASQHTTAQREIRAARNTLRDAVETICEDQGNW